MPSIHELAQQLHLGKLPDILDPMKTNKELTAIANQSFSILCRPTEVECRQWDEPGWPIALKKAFEVAVHDTNKCKDIFSLTYREETPGHYVLDGVAISCDRQEITEILQQKEPAAKAILQIIEKDLDPAFPSLCQFLRSELS